MFFRSKKQFLRLKSLKNKSLGLQSQIDNRQGDFCQVYGKKYEDPKKKVDKKFRRNEVKYFDFRHFLGKC